MKFESFKVANVSTRHTTEKDGEDLGALACMSNEHGGLIPTSIDWMNGQDGGSDALWDIVRAARKQGFNYVWFDADGGDLEGAPEFDW